MAALPQCIQSAKQLYDLRSRYKDASVLITAIYSESMVIAASLSQIQNLLHRDALQQKPELLETFDRALTGCRVVYGCLEEEVRDLVAKAENDELKFKDRAKFLWKEDTFKELLTQIRGQQSALSLLIQGLQMESIADIQKLVQKNSVTLDQVVKRLRTLRQSHPRVKVPESLLSQQSRLEHEADIESIVNATEFTFDDEVVNSKAYRRAMTMALSTSRNQSKAADVLEAHVQEDEPIISEPLRRDSNENKDAELTVLFPTSSTVDDARQNSTEANEAHEASPESAIPNEHQDLFDTLERDILSFMPQVTSTAPYSTPATTRVDTLPTPSQTTSPLAPAPLMSYSEGLQISNVESPPPLPPRRPSGQPTQPEKIPVASMSSDDSIHTSDAPSILSKVSTASSYTLYEASQASSSQPRRPAEMPLPLVQKSSSNTLGEVSNISPEIKSFDTPPPLFNAEMYAIWMALIDAERKFVDRMIKLKRMFHDHIIRQWPVLEKHLGAILVGEKLANLHQLHLLEAMEVQLAGNSYAPCDPYLFEAWTERTQQLFREYCRKMPHTYSSLRTTQNMDPKFTPFVNTLGLSIAYFGQSWEDYLRLPNVQLQSYVDNLQSLVKIAERLGPAATQQTMRLRRALQAVTWLRTSTSAQLEEAQGREDVQNLNKRIRTDASTLSQLRLHESIRRVRHQGGMAMKFKGQGPWIPVHAMLLDNYFLWGKAKKSKGDEITIVDAPTSVVNMELTLPSDAHQFQKATMLDQIARGVVVLVLAFTSQ
jgi:hypothetical protein